MGAIFFALLACAEGPVDTATNTDVPDVDESDVEVPCALQAPFEGASQLQWGALLAGITGPADRCEDGEPCALSDGSMLEAAWRQASTGDWIDGYHWVLNDPPDAWVMVYEDSAGVDGCRITLVY